MPESCSSRTVRLTARPLRAIRTATHQIAPPTRAHASENVPPEFQIHSSGGDRMQLSTPKPTRNLAARMGRWSANHRKTAIFGWLAFVIAAFVIGTAVG